MYTLVLLIGPQYSDAYALYDDFRVSRRRLWTAVFWDGYNSRL